VVVVVVVVVKESQTTVDQSSSIDVEGIATNGLGQRTPHGNFHSKNRYYERESHINKNSFYS
jgi:hypothetical protein